MNGDEALQVFPGDGKRHSRRPRAYENRQNYSTRHRQSFDTGGISRRKNLTVWPRFYIPRMEEEVGGLVGPRVYPCLSHFSTPSACCRWEAFDQEAAMSRNQVFRSREFRCTRCRALLAIEREGGIEVCRGDFEGMAGDWLSTTCYRCRHLNLFARTNCKGPTPKAVGVAAD